MAIEFTEMGAKCGEKMFTLSEVSAFLRTSLPTLKRIIDRGELRAKKVGRQWRISQSAIDEYMETLQ